MVKHAVWACTTVAGMAPVCQGSARRPQVTVWFHADVDPERRHAFNLLDQHPLTLLAMPCCRMLGRAGYNLGLWRPAGDCQPHVWAILLLS